MIAETQTNGRNITIPGPNIKTMLVTVEGTSSLISSAMPQHVIEQEKARATGQPIPKAPKKSAEEQFTDALYNHPLGGHGWKSVAFKDCIQQGAKDVNGVAGTHIQRNVHVYGEGGQEMIQIEGEPQEYDNVVRNEKTGGMAVAICGEFPKWTATLEIRFNAQILSAEQVIHCLNQGGFSTGIGHKRALGFGRFKVKSTDQE